MCPQTHQPGQWVSGIVVEAKNKVASQKPGQKARVQITIRDLTIVAVQVNVPGRRSSTSRSARSRPAAARASRRSSCTSRTPGTCSSKPTGTVTISKASGELVQSLPFQMDTFLPQTAIDYPLLLKKALPAGDYTAAVRLRVPGVATTPGKLVTSTPSFTVSDADVKQVFSSSQPTQAPPSGSTSSSSSSSVPTWAYVAIAAAIVVLVVLAILLLVRRRRRRAGKQPATPTTVVRLPPLQPEPEPAPEPIAAAAGPPEPSPTTPAPAACTPYHYWEVDYEHGVQGADGQWRFPHRCRNCGLEVLARDVSDATDQANRR